MVVYFSTSAATIVSALPGETRSSKIATFYLNTVYCFTNKRTLTVPLLCAFIITAISGEYGLAISFLVSFLSLIPAITFWGFYGPDIFCVAQPTV